MTTATRGEAHVEIAAPAARVYDLVADVTRIGERSPECYRVEWLDGATAAVVGARFRGYNRIGPIKWSTVCVITKSEPGNVQDFIDVLQDKLDEKLNDNPPESPPTPDFPLPRHLACVPHGSSAT